MKNKLILLLAVVFAIITAIGAYKYLDNLKETYRTSGNFAQVAVAKVRIPTKTPINEQMLEFKEMPVEYIMAGAIVDSKDAVGKLARADIYPGEQILTNKLIGKDDPAGGLAAQVEQGKRAVTLPVNNIAALHGLLVVGDHVDVMVTFNAPTEQKEPTTSTIIQNVPVMAVNKQTAGVANEAVEEPQTVTLMMEPGQAQQVALAIQQGTIQLMMRAPKDDAFVPLPMSRLEHLLR